ncbi:DNA-binding transcription factor [Collariella sp. IMI 366227]|nr:DNA-binding transcription factor [Collariella sp. IMI 366227]
MPYNYQPAATTPFPRHEVHQNLSPATYSQAGTPSPASPYHMPSPYGGFAAYSPPRLDAPLAPHTPLENSQDCVQGSSCAKRSCSPQIKRESRSTSPRSITANVRVQGAPVYEFHTPIDKLARAIDSELQLAEPSAEVSAKEKAQAPEEEEPKETTKGRGKGKKPKRFFCDIPGCKKGFAQRNNLETHLRAHTGEAPYTCRICHRGFTQGVNLNSHMNRHLGRRPYQCDICGKGFCQPSNLKSHKSTHLPKELRRHWVCKLGGCTKALTAKGNLKNHQNTYHLDILETYIAKLQSGVALPEEERELLKHIRMVHNLANKGIKGRGKGRKVDVIPQPPSHQPIPMDVAPAMHHAPPHYSAGFLPQHHNLPQLHHAPPPAAFYGRPNPHQPVFNTMGGRPPAMHFDGGFTARDMPLHGPYGMLDSDQLSDVSSVPSPVMHSYEDIHGRDMGYGGRMY